MIQIQGKLDREIYVACSGGVDSMAVVDFLMKNHTVNLMFFDHGTETSKEALDFLTSRYYPSIEHAGMKLFVGSVSRPRNKSESWEEYWRNQRYQWFHSYEHKIITCHHLDDCVETWIFNSLNGEGRIIPYSNWNVIRPFRLNRKSEFTNWCRNKNVPWVEDTSNEDIGYMRNFIRHEIVPKALVVNPGLHKVIRKKVLEDAPKTP
jgi:tRNA(Ile)-lysidine synthetase-like protein